MEAPSDGCVSKRGCSNRTLENTLAQVGKPAEPRVIPAFIAAGARYKPMETDGLSGTGSRRSVSIRRLRQATKANRLSYFDPSIPWNFCILAK